MPGRTPANTAMTAATLDLMSGGRFLLGLGTSGPQVVEGWHGEPWGKPITRTREYVAIVRAALRRDAVEFHGSEYDVPYNGNGATGLGKPLKLLVRGHRADIPIYLAAIGPKNLELTGEIADGWLPMFFAADHAAEQLAVVRAGRAKAEKDLTGFDVVATLPISIGINLDDCARPSRPLASPCARGPRASLKTSSSRHSCAPVSTLTPT